MLHLLHNLINVWSKELWYVSSILYFDSDLNPSHIITQNWLLNPTGKPNTFMENDLVQEHLNFWIKVSFQFA
jgi:hypothetical protein